MDPIDPAPHDASEAARLRRRDVLIEPPDRGPEPPGFLREHGVQLEALAVIRRGERFRVLAEST